MEIRIKFKGENVDLKLISNDLPNLKVLEIYRDGMYVGDISDEYSGGYSPEFVNSDEEYECVQFQIIDEIKGRIPDFFDESKF